MNQTKIDCEKAGDWQCTKYAYYRANELNGSYPCWYNGSGSKGTGLYRNAKLWGKHFRTPYVFIDKNSIKEYKAGDVLVFDGNYGHVAIVESVQSDKLLVSDCNYIAPYTYNERLWTIADKMNGTGSLLGVLRIESEETKEYTSTTKTIHELAEEVIAGKWGNYPERKTLLTNAGYKYSEVQKEVNSIMYGSKTNEQIAKEVIAGKWGNNPYRKETLKSLGYDYSKIQEIVNKMMSEKK